MAEDLFPTRDVVNVKADKLWRLEQDMARALRRFNDSGRKDQDAAAEYRRLHARWSAVKAQEVLF